MANDDDQKPLTLYSDMVGDLFHFGHVCFLKKARAILEEKCNTAYDGNFKMFFEDIKRTCSRPLPSQSQRAP